MNENIIVPPPLHPLLADRNRGRGRPDSNNRKKKTLIRVFIVGFFATILYFFTVQKGRNIYRGGGGEGVQLFIIFLGGGGRGGTNPYFYRNLYNL